MPFMPNPHKWHFYLHILTTHYSLLSTNYYGQEKDYQSHYHGSHSRTGR